MRARRMFIVIGGALLLMAMGWAGWALFAPVGRVGSVRFPVYRNATIQEVANELQRNRMIRSRWLFLRLSDWFGLDKNLRAGIFQFRSPISVWRLVRLLRWQKPEYIKVTVSEGLMAKEIAKRLARMGLVDAERFMSLVRSPNEQIRLSAGIPSGNIGGLEGFLFPDTYSFPPLRSGEEAFVIQTMLNQFEAKVLCPYRDEIARSKFTLFELVTLASIIQWEVLQDDERPIVAGVLINRLRDGMRLECDATALYALGVRKGRVLYRDLQVDSPYNTYRHEGLPPGPICSPGLKSFLAALRPASVEYRFYVARFDGTRRHYFTRTYAEHLQAVQRARQNRRRRAYGK